MKRWVCELTIEADEPEMVEILQALKAQLGLRMRSRTREAWLAEAESQPIAPMMIAQVAGYDGPRGHFRRRAS